MFVSVDREPNGTVLDRIECVECPSGTRPALNGRECEVCDGQDGGCCGLVVCPSLGALDWPADDASFTITYLNGQKVVSSFLRESLRKAVLSCQVILGELAETRIAFKESQ